MTNEEEKKYLDQFQGKLAEQNKKHFGKIVIATLYQLGQKEGAFSTDYKTVKRSAMPIEMSYVNEINSNAHTMGRFYIIDEDETAKWRVLLTNENETAKRAEEIKEESVLAVADSLSAIKRNLKIKNSDFKKRADEEKLKEDTKEIREKLETNHTPLTDEQKKANIARNSSNQ